MPTVHLLINGKVQGVFYRATARQKAELLGIRGWIRNTADGDVEAVVSGGEYQVSQFVQWCRKGPPRAAVTNVSITAMAEESFESFEVRRGG
jgi:acylphosphatase